MTPRVTTRQRLILLALIILGFAGLIGAHEVAVRVPSADHASNAFWTFILAALGTGCFVAAGLMARGLMR